MLLAVSEPAQLRLQRLHSHDYVVMMQLSGCYHCMSYLHRLLAETCMHAHNAPAHNSPPNGFSTLAATAGVSRCVAASAAWNRSSKLDAGSPIVALHNDTLLADPQSCKSNTTAGQQLSYHVA